MSEDLETFSDEHLDAIADLARPHGPCVYVLRTELGFKIGRTSNLSHRLSTLQTGSPTRFVTEAVIYTGEATALESALHRRFATKRTQGEWFALAPEDVAFICALDRRTIRGVIDYDIPF